MLPRAHGRHVELGFAEVDAHRFTQGGGVKGFSHRKIGLRGNTAAMQTDAAQGAVAFDDGGSDSVRGRPERGVIASRPAADHQQVGFLREFTDHHRMSP